MIHSCPCGNPTRAEGQRYCRECHNASMRRTRPRHRELTEAERAKANARSYLNTYVARGIIDRLSCEVCGTTTRVHGHHHAGYDRPLWVRWLCATHHREEHRRTG